MTKLAISGSLCRSYPLNFRSNYGTMIGHGENVFMDEKVLKLRLIDYLLKKKYPKCKLIGVEVPFVSMKRRVDVLVITGNMELIAFEIKSDLDSLRRLNDQVKDYKKTFDKLYIVTSAKYKDICSSANIGNSIGCIYINGGIDERKKAKQVKQLDKYNLARFLLKDDLTKLGYDKQESVETLRMKLVKEVKPTENVRKLAINSLLRRYSKRFELFKKHKEPNTLLSDLDYLTKNFDISL